jgi:hypothetical protein
MDLIGKAMAFVWHGVVASFYSLFLVFFLLLC